MSSIKHEIKELLTDRKYRNLLTLQAEKSKIISRLISLSYDKTSSVSWRAIEAIGIISGIVSETDPEFVRNLVGRLLWMIRDESGGIGWSVPEILGEIIRNNPELCDDIPSIVVSFHDEKMLTAAVLWAVSRMRTINSDTVEYAVPIIKNYIRSDDPVKRGYAARALGELGKDSVLYDLEKLLTDKSVIPVYENGELTEQTVGKLAEEAISKISGHQHLTR